MESKVLSNIRIGVVSFSLLLYQILLTRVFSVITWYHLAFLAISLSMFGLCLGSFVNYLFRSFFSSERYQKIVFFQGLLMGLFMAFSIFLLSFIGKNFSDPFANIWIAILIFLFCAVPFYLGGSIISLVIRDYKGHIGRLYAFDLFAAALACYAIVGILKFISVPHAIALLGVFNIVSSSLFYRDQLGLFKIKGVLSSLSLIIVGILVVGYFFIDSKSWFQIRSGKTSDDHVTSVFEKWNSFSRINVVPMQDLKPFGWGLTQRMTEFQGVRQFHLVIDGIAGTVLTKFDGDLSKLEYLKYDSVNIGQYLRKDSDVFVIGVGGGRDILTSLVFNQKSVIGAEINDSILDTVNNRFGDFTGHLDQISNVAFVNEEARSFLARTDKKFDLIVMSLIDTFAATSAGAFALSENAIYTKQAFKLFLEKIKDGGVISVSRWWLDSSPHEAYKMLKIATESLREIGISEPEKHIILVKTTQGRFSEQSKDFNVATLLFSNKPFSSADLLELDQIVNKLDLKAILSPMILPTGPIKEILKGLEISAPEFSHLNLDTPTDDSPFFFQFNKIDSINPFKISEKFLNSLVWLLWLGFIFLVAVVTGSFFFNKTKKTDRSYMLGLTFYFLFIGFGYLLVELSQMQRLGIFLGHPIYSLTTTLFAFLFCSGLGSFFSDQIYNRMVQPNFLFSFLSGFLIISIVSGFFTQTIIESNSSLNLIFRIAISFCLLAPAAFFMGIMLPIGLRTLPSTDQNSRAWLWGVNGASSVVASILSSVLSIYNGISFTYWTGFFFYLLAVITFLTVIVASRETKLNQANF
jgi:hypothetical protein